jgi:hypothetical protein
MLSKFVNIPIFIISLSLGLLFVYLSNPHMTTIFVYPTPDNINKLQFKDKADNCFEFQSSEIKCPSDKSKIKTIPFQK